MTISITTQSSEIPQDLPSYDFGFEIDYVKNVGPARRAFGATHRFIEACETFNKHLLGSIGVTVEPVVVLEDIELGSLKTRYKVFWNEEEENALKSGDVKRILCTFFIEGVKIIVGKTNDSSSPANLSSIRDNIYQLTKEVDYETLFIQTPISVNNLIDSIQQFESIKELLTDEDKAGLILADETQIRINQFVIVDIEKLRKEATRETLVHQNLAMILIVRKPDYLGNSQWQFRHENKNFMALIEHKEWLFKFQHRKVDVRPGDALKCMVKIETAYGYDNEVVSEKYYITKFFEVIENQGEKYDPPDLFTE